MANFYPSDKISVYVDFNLSPLTQSGIWRYRVYEQYPIDEDNRTVLSNTALKIFEGTTYLEASSSKPLYTKDFDITDIVNQRREIYNSTSENSVSRHQRINLLNVYYVVIDIPGSLGSEKTSSSMVVYFGKLYPNQREVYCPLSISYNFQYVSSYYQNVPFELLIQGNKFPQENTYPVLLPHIPWLPWALDNIDDTDVRDYDENFLIQ